MNISDLNFVSRAALRRAPNTETNSLGKEILAGLSEVTSSLEPSVRNRISPLLNSLQHEKDGVFGLEGLLQVGIRLKSEQQEGAARYLLQRLSQGDVPQEIRERAQREYGAAAGQGSFGMRAEYFVSRLVQEDAMRAIAPMIGATVIGQVVETTLLGRLLGTASRGFWARGLGAKLAAGAGAFMVEFPTFAGLSRALSPTSNGPVSDDLFRAMLGLGAFRVFSGVGNVGASLASGIAPRLARPLQYLLPQSSIFLGLLASHRLEGHYKLRPELEDATTTTDVLGSMASLLIGANLGLRFLGRPFAAFRKEMEFRAESFAKFGEIKARPNPFPSATPVALGKVGGRPTVSDSGISRDHIVYAVGDSFSGTRTSANFPSSEQIIQEIGRLHRSWRKEGGRIQIEGEGKEVDPAMVDLGDLQKAMWDLGTRPIVAGNDPLISPLWGTLKPFFANLNNPPVLYTRNLGHAYYLLGLSIILGRPLESVNLPDMPKVKEVEVPQYIALPFDLLWAKYHWTTGSRLRLTWSQIVEQFFSGNQNLAADFAHEVHGEDWMRRRGWYGTSARTLSTSSSPQVPRASILEQPDSVRRRLFYDLTLNDVKEIIPKDDGGPPSNYLALTEAVRKGEFEHILIEGNCIGWWTPLEGKGGFQANILGRIADFTPGEVFTLLNKRDEWTVFYPGFYHVEQVRSLGKGQAIFRLGMRTPAGRIRMLTKHTSVPDQFQIRWDDPKELAKDIDYQQERDEKLIMRIQGSITAAPSPAGNGSLVLYELFMTSQQTSGEVDPYADVRRGEVATMARVPPLLTSLSAKLAAVRDGRDWGIQNSEDLLAYRNSTDPNPLKGPSPAGVKYNPKVWVIDK